MLAAETPSIGIAWLSLDKDENDLARFLMYLIAVLRSVESDLGEGVLGALLSPQPPSSEAILTELVN